MGDPYSCSCCDEGISHDDVVARMKAKIAQNGWTAQGILANENQPGWTYTIGLDQSRSHPDLLIVGLDQKVAYYVLDVLAQRVMAGERFEPGQSLSGLLAGDYELVVIEVDDVTEGDIFNMATFFYEGWNFTALQLVWPDMDGNYPWEPGYERGYHQCLVGQPPG